MGLIASIKKTFIQKAPGTTIDSQFSQAEMYAGDKRDFQLYGPCNEDFAPPFNILALPVNVGRGGGFLILYSYCNEQIAPIALPGERRLYSTNEDGNTVKAEIFIKNTGSILIKNDIGSFEMKVNGEFEINGATITTGGDFITASGISLDNHTHPQGPDSATNTQQNTGVAI